MTRDNDNSDSNDIDTRKIAMLIFATSEVVFTLCPQAGVTDEAFEKDAATIAADPKRLAAALGAS